MVHSIGSISGWPRFLPAKFLGNFDFPEDGVTTVILTYNSAETLPRALQSAASQILERPHSVLFLDDASTDDTQVLIQDFLDKFPRAAAILSDQNLYQQGYRQRFLAARIVKNGLLAFLDADDEWCSPRKLQLQCSYMSRYPSTTLSCTSWYWMSPDGQRLRSFPRPGRFRKRLSLASLSSGNPIATSSVLCRARHVAALPFDYLTNVKCQDYELWVHLAAQGDIHVQESFDTAIGVHTSRFQQLTAGNDPNCRIRLAPEIEHGVPLRSRTLWKLGSALPSVSDSESASEPKKSLQRLMRLLIEACAGNLTLPLTHEPELKRGSENVE